MSRIGPYELIRELGRGGMGTVWLARDPGLGREVAIKTLTTRARSPASWERLVREARAVARLSHPNVIRVHAFEPEADPPYLVMERIVGPTLAAYLASAPRERLLGIVVRVARALEAAHAAGIAHRDVKPENVLIEEETGRPVVTDFGLALELSEDSPEERLTSSGVTVGTLEYLSPEQASGRRDAQGAPADVWALGVLLYRVLTGRLPFRGVTPVEVMLQVTRAEAVPPSRLAAVPAGLERLCLQALSRDPADRPDAGRFAALLEQELSRVEAVTGEQPAAGPPTAARERRRRLPLLPFLCMAALAGLALAIGALEHRARRPLPGPRPEPAPPAPGPPPAPAPSPPDDPLLPRQWALPAIGLGGGLGGPGWPRPSSVIVVAIADSGTDTAHPELQGVLWRGGSADTFGWNWVSDIGGEQTDDLGSGTHMAGLIAAPPGDGIGIAGMNPRVRVMALRTVGRGSPSSRPERLAAALRFAVEHEARVFGVARSELFAEREVAVAARHALQGGLLLVIGDTGGLEDPELRSRVVLVAPATRTGLPAAPGGHLLAPGSDVLSLGAELVDAGLGNREPHASRSGTEPAVALVAGAASLVLGCRPDLDAERLRRVLLQSARPVPDHPGYGHLDVPAALSADPARWIEAELDGMANSVEAVVIRGTADADQFVEAWLEIAAEPAHRWERLPGTLTRPVRGGVLGMVPMTEVLQHGDAGRRVWVRLVVRHASGATRSARIELDPPRGQLFQRPR